MWTHWIRHTFGVVAAALIWLWAGSLTIAAQPADMDEDSAPQSSFAELDRYGKWIVHPEWGSVWSPDVDDDWRPYTVGRWVNTEEHGWYWESDEPFGWAVYHYGRWLDDEQEGWIWVPGTEWGPAWVAWRYGEDVVGWAPLPPQAAWYPERGVIIDEDFYYGARFAPLWIFVAPRYLLSPQVHRHAYPFSRNITFYPRTRPATRYGWDNRRIFNHGIPTREIERLTHAPVPSTRLMSSSRPVGTMRREAGGAVLTYRPAIVPSERWRSGRNGDWRRFEPARPERPRPERGFVPPPRDATSTGARRPLGDSRVPRDGARTGPTWSAPAAPSRDRRFSAPPPYASPSPAQPREPRFDAARRDGEFERRRELRDDRWRDYGRGREAIPQRDDNDRRRAPLPQFSPRASAPPTASPRPQFAPPPRAHQAAPPPQRQHVAPLPRLVPRAPRPDRAPPPKTPPPAQQ